MEKTFGVIGGDSRQRSLAELLLRDGRKVLTWGVEESERIKNTGLEKALSAQVVILPLPVLAAGGVFNAPFARREVRIPELLDSFEQEKFDKILRRESQVDRLGAALLMPRYMVMNNVDRFTAGKPISIYGNNLLRLEDKLLVQKIADTMGVSYTAFFIRLKQLDLCIKRSAEEYITLEMGLGNEAMPL